jgi:putative transcriptional regulator
MPIESIHAYAPLYAIGALGPDEALRFEEHLRGGCPSCDEDLEAHRRVVGELALLAPDVEPPLRLRSRILEAASPNARDTSSGSAQVWKRWTPPKENPEWFLLRGRDGDWEGIGIDGVSVCRLFTDPSRDSVTMLIRMDPGSIYPSHRHGGPEECYVLEGDLKIGDVVMRKGDYQRVERQSVHPVQSTDGGCLLLIVSSLHDEIIS